MNKSIFADRLNRAADGEWDFVRLSCVEFNTFTKVAEYSFIYPESKTPIVEQNRAKLEEICKKILQSSLFATVIVLRASHFDEKIFLPQLFDIIKPYAAIVSGLNASHLSVSRQNSNPQDARSTADNNTIKVEISLEQAIYEYAKNTHLIKDIKAKLQHSYTQDFDIQLKAYQLSQAEQEQRELARSQDTSSRLERPEGREIKVTDIQPVFGETTFSPPQYIVDIASIPKNSVTICGDVLQWDISTAKSGKPYVRLELSDFTGAIKGVLFATNKTEPFFDKIKAGTQIIAKGKTEANEYAGKTTIQFKPDSVAFCKLPTDFVINKKRRQVPLAYTTIYPKTYKDSTQQTMDLDTLSNKTNPTNDKKTLPDTVVFDLETTGLDPKLATIIELGAAKIVDGRIVETFETLIDPLKPIPPETTAINHITNEMVQGCPTLEPVLMDFLKFCQGSILVAHNMDFDYSFISTHGKKYDIYFDNPRQDTLAMARQHYPKLKNHKLETLCNSLNIPNDDAHRALSDVIATARLYIKMNET